MRAEEHQKEEGVEAGLEVEAVEMQVVEAAARVT